jgi:hypothetical protein
MSDHPILVVSASHRQSMPGVALVTLIGFRWLSHEPLALFKAGAHQRLALLNERSCLTCHTFQNTCSECHLAKRQ